MNKMVCFRPCFRRKTTSKMISFEFFVCGIVRQLLYGSWNAILLFHVEKSSDYVKDADVSRFADLHHCLL